MPPFPLSCCMHGKSWTYRRKIMRSHLPLCTTIHNNITLRSDRTLDVHGVCACSDPDITAERALLGDNYIDNFSNCPTFCMKTYGHIILWCTVFPLLYCPKIHSLHFTKPFQTLCSLYTFIFPFYDSIIYTTDCTVLYCTAPHNSLLFPFSITVFLHCPLVLKSKCVTSTKATSVELLSL